MKKLILTTSTIVLFTIYSLFQRNNGTNIIAKNLNSTSMPKNIAIPSPANSSIPTIIPTSTTGSTNPPVNHTTTPTKTITQTPTNTPTVVPTIKKGQYTDGQYTGSTENAFYGNVQVQIVVANSQISDVIFLQYPNTHHESIQINSSAMPILKQEAIKAQNANVDMVSGATFTSEAFIKSLDSAISQAM